MLARVSQAVVLVTCLGGAIAVSSAAPVPKGSPRSALYHPARVGAKWVYQSGDRDSVEVVTAVEDKDGEKWVTISREFGSGLLPTQIVSVSGKGLAIVETVAIDLKEPVWQLKLPHRVRNKWEVVVDCTPLGRLIGRADADGPEQVTTPSGTYRAIRVRYEMPDPDTREGKARRTVWYAPGVGKVKQIVDDRVELLKSFDPGKE